MKKKTPYERYEELRDAKGVTDYKVSVETGIANATIYEWKAGKYTPKADKMIALAKYFDVPVEELL